MAKRRTKKLSDQLRDAIDGSGLSASRIAKEIGMDLSHLQKFRRGEAGISVARLDRITEVLNLAIIARPKPSAPKGR